MMENIIIALKIMGQGMLGIFTATIIIMLVTMLMKKFFPQDKKKEV